jgi:hypothetical protein
MIKIHHVAYLMQKTDRRLILKGYLRHKEGLRCAKLLKTLEDALDLFEKNLLD